MRRLLYVPVNGHRDVLAEGLAIFEETEWLEDWLQVAHHEIVVGAVEILRVYHLVFKGHIKRVVYPIYLTRLTACNYGFESEMMQMLSGLIFGVGCEDPNGLSLLNIVKLSVKLIIEVSYSIASDWTF